MHKFKALAVSALAVIAQAIAAVDARGAGPDIQYSGLGGSIMSHGAVGTINAYTLGSNTCNIGNLSLSWVNNGTPGLSMNAFRLANGRLEQIGTGMVKTACCVGNTSGCNLTCTTTGGGLRAGCMDTYSASWNSQQTRLCPRSLINGFTGTFASIPAFSGNATTSRRLQIQQADMSAITYPNALYFVEGQYICTEDANNSNWWNNASYNRVTIGANFVFSAVNTATDFFRTARPAIYAWQDHGLGAGVPDPSVVIQNVEIPGEGRFIVASKVTQNGKLWHYEYAIHNFNSDRAAGGFRVPLPSGAVVSNSGFHDVWYHDEDAVISGTDWNSSTSTFEQRWSVTQTFAQNPNANSIRWGTMYNFWFDCDRAPVSSNAEIELFKPAAGCQPVKVAFTTNVPGAECVNDVARNGTVDVADLLAVISGWGACTCGVNCPANVETSGGNTVVDVADLLSVINAWGGCP